MNVLSFYTTISKNIHNNTKKTSRLYTKNYKDYKIKNKYIYIYISHIWINVNIMP